MRTKRTRLVAVLAVVGTALGACSNNADSTGDEAGPASTDGDDLAAHLLVEGDADGLWGAEKDDAALGAQTQQSPADLMPVEPLFTACDPPGPQPTPVLDAAVRNHRLSVGGEPVGQAYQTIVTGPSDDVARMYDALSAAATSCVDGPPDGPPVTVTPVDVGDIGQDVVAVRSSEEQAWYVVVDAGTHAVVIAGFGDLDATEPVELTDAQIGAIARAATDRLP